MFLNRLHILLRLLLCLYLSNFWIAVSAQSLKVGDKIPEVFWKQSLVVANHPQAKEIITLDEYRGKPLILEFWNTTCGTCVGKMPTIKLMQETYKDKATILPITSQKSASLQKFYNSKSGTSHKTMLTVYDDSLLTSLFPFLGVPHIIWIDETGRYINATQIGELTEKNIDALVENRPNKMLTKIDIGKKDPLFLSSDFPDYLSLEHYSILIKGFYPGLPTGKSVKKNDNGKVYAKRFTNLPLIHFYNPVAIDYFNRNGEIFSKKRVIAAVKTPSYLSFITKQDGSTEKHNLYNYELVVTEQNIDSINDFILQDMNRYTDYIASVKPMEMECLVLIRTDSIDKIKSRGIGLQNTFPAKESKLINCPIGYMLERLNDSDITALPIIDETGYKHHVDISISNLTDITSLNEGLFQYDLKLVQRKRVISMLVIEDKSSVHSNAISDLNR